ncbi:MAG: glycosyltransferase family 4 protein [Paludibacteraceae bacterium]|nr:glycosyltransferase family 4 protein [Paludibacteraceae bacterium]
MDKKKIVWITPDCFYDVDWPIVNRLVEFYDIRWYCIWNSKSLREIPVNANVFRIIQLKDRYRSLKNISIYISLLKEIKSFNPTIIYNGFGGRPYFFPLLFHYFDKKDVIFEGHEIDPKVSAYSNLISDSYIRYYLRRVGLTQVFSKHSEKQFHELYPNQKCTYIPMVPKDYGMPCNLIEHGNRKVFLFFGGIRSNKRFDILLDAFLKLDSKHSEKAELWVYGNASPEEIDKYTSMAVGHENIILKLRFVPDDMVANLFCSSTYLVLPYERITQSGPMMIAYNYNTPLIGSNIAGFKERIKDGENGYLFKNGDVADLKRLLEQCIDQDDEEYNRIKRNSMRFVDEEYSPKVVIRRYREMLDQRTSELSKGTK